MLYEQRFDWLKLVLRIGLAVTVAAVIFLWTWVNFALGLAVWMNSFCGGLGVFIYLIGYIPLAIIVLAIYSSLFHIWYIY